MTTGTKGDAQSASRGRLPALREAGMAAAHPDLWLPPRQWPRAPPEGRLLGVKAGKRGGRRREYRLALCLDPPPAVSARAANRDAIEGETGRVTDRANTIPDARTPLPLDAQRRLDESAATGYFQVIGGRIARGPCR
jgi:hypothetical protein